MDPHNVCPVCSSPVAAGLPTCPVCSFRLLASSIHLATTTAAAPDLKRGAAYGAPFPRQVGDFTLLAPLGRGGSATVYLAYQESMRRRVALKVLDLSAFQWGTEETRFEHEAWIAGRLSHPHIVRVFERGIDGSNRFIVMELVEGRSLAAFLDEARTRRTASPVSDSEWRRRHVKRIVEWFVDVADALEYVHTQGVIHRDIKPLNLLLADGETRLLLTDFGLARDQAVERVTVSGDFMGTIRYMSPEQLLAQRAKVDHRTDLWSLGVSLYEAVTLDLPFAADTEEGYISAVATKEPVPPRRRDRAIPRDLETIVMKCLQRDPDQRYTSAAEFRDDCKRYLADQPVNARRPGVVVRVVRFGTRRRRVIAGLLAASALAVAATYAVLATLTGMDEVARTRDQVAGTRERLRQILEQVRVTGAGPEQLAPDWNTLVAMLREETGRDPHGALANEARVATTRVAARIGSPIDAQNPQRILMDFDPPEVPFGLLSHSPVVHLVVWRIFDVGVPIHTVVQLEASVDGETWSPMGWATAYFRETRAQRPRSVCSFPLPGRARVAGPHRLEFRATVTFQDLFETEKAFGQSCGTSGPALPDKLALRPVLSQSIKTLEPATVSLFAQYPPDFPPRIDPATLTPSVDTWFQPERFRLVQVRLPRRTASAFVVSDPWEVSSGRTVAVIRCASNAISDAAPLIGIEMSGVFTATPPIPIAATLEWRPIDSQNVLLSVPLVAGAGVFKFGGAARTLSETVPGSSTGGVRSGAAPSAPEAQLRLRLEGPLALLSARSGRSPILVSVDNRSGQRTGRFTEKAIVFSDPVWQRRLLPEKSTAGVLDVRPARDLALANYFERYIGALQIPASLDVRTVDGTWVDDTRCASLSPRR